MMSTGQIAKRQAVRSARAALNVKIRTQLVILASKGMSRQQIADKLGWPKSKTNHALLRFNIKTTHPTGVREGRKERRCKVCGETDPKKFFVNRKLSYSLCKKCRNAKYLARYHRNRSAALQFMGGKCERCHYKRCAAALHFHHLDPRKKDPNWLYLKNKPLHRIKTELKKCILVCANCHAEIHVGFGMVEADFEKSGYRHTGRSR